LVVLGFRDHLGLPISSAITDDTTNHPPGVTHFAFCSTIGPNTVNVRLSIPSHSFEFWLELPQTMLGAKAPSVPAAAEIVCTMLNFATPHKNAASSPAPALDALVTAADIAAMRAAAQAALGAASSINVLSDHAQDCFARLTAAQI
jgi:hypothetical protein